MTVYLQAIVALVLVVSLMLCLLWVLRRFSPGVGGAQFTRSKRLKLVEALTLDHKHRAVILACDGREHLVILSSDGETVIENNLPAVPENGLSLQDKQQAKKADKPAKDKKS